MKHKPFVYERLWERLGVVLQLGILTLVGFFGSQALFAVSLFDWEKTPAIDKRLKPAMKRQLQNLTRSGVLRANDNEATPQETLLPTVPSGRGTQVLYLLVVPVSYADTNITLSRAEIETLLFSKVEDDYYSVSEYYLLNSRNKLEFRGYVVPPGEVVLRKPKRSYSRQVLEPTGFLLEAANQLGAYFQASGHTDDLLRKSNYDRNGDSHIDIIVFLHAGEGAETLPPDEKDGSMISHMYSYRRQGYNVLMGAGPLEGLYFGRYAIVGEYNDTNQRTPLKKATIGTLCHELGHCLGLVDLYNTLPNASQDSSVGRLALMGTGNYNVPASNRTERFGIGSLPAPFISMHKILLGWEEPILIDSNNQGTFTINDYSASNASKHIYKVVGRQPHQYWLIEYRKNTLFDEGFQGAKGLLIWHINEDIIALDKESSATHKHYFLTPAGINNIPTNRGIQLEEPHANVESPSNKIVTIDPSYFWFFDMEGITPYSKPNTKYHPSGLHSGVSIKNIRTNTPSTMQFTVLIETITNAQYHAVSYPNPFIPSRSQTLQIVVNHSESRHLNTFPRNVRLNIVSRSGQVVYAFSHHKGNLFFINQDTSLVASWDGQDMKGRSLATGVYYYMVVGDTFRWVAGRFLLLR